MPRYYFDVINGEGPMPDDDGIELPTKDAIPATAARMLLDLASDEVDYQQAANFKVQVRDQQGAAIFRATLSFSSNWLIR
ncbi:DUF6894 family protein [Neorhizobium sp. DT-125]|uniref:DUF6894 family protein n=1 Tax=Neorhizobium sp. DT-125 TaxID=3396163 RepID=UPI003F1B7625